jgi:hypothetical protein
MLSRRDILTTTIGVAIAHLGVPIVRSNCVAGLLEALCADLPCAEWIGTACTRALVPEEATSERLALQIMADLSTIDRNCTSIGSLKQVVRKQIQDEFHSGKVVDVDGWLFSLTEARIYALTVLLREKRAMRLSS